MNGWSERFRDALRNECTWAWFHSAEDEINNRGSCGGCAPASVDGLGGFTTVIQDVHFFSKIWGQIVTHAF